MEFNDRQTKVLTAIDAAQDMIIEVSRAIHAHPELGDQEVFASTLLADELEARGFYVERGWCGRKTAFRARKGGVGGPGHAGGPKVAFMAEYDALPGIGHGCGHNLICSSALAAGIGLGEVAAELDCEVWVVGTPAEETDGAKVAMAAAGAFDGLDAALMIHPYDGNFSHTESLAMDAIELEYRGAPAHAAASPWEGRNALDALIIAFTSINALRQQMRPDARVHGIITDGGKAPNIIPDRAVARFYIRARKRSYLDTLVAQFTACAQAAALATDTELSMRNYEGSFDDMVNNEALAGRMRAWLEGPPDEAPLGAGAFQRCPDSFGSIDMGNVSHVVPAAHVLVDVTGGRKMAIHTPEFRDAACSPVAEAALVRAAKALALTGFDLFADKAFLDQVRRDFDAATGGVRG